MLIAFSVEVYLVSRKLITIDAIMYKIEFIRKETDENIFVRAAFIDLSMAFDSINHEIPSIHLNNPGFEIPALKLIGIFLSDRIQSVVLKIIISDNLSVERAVPQGTVLGPVLCNQYINDLQNQANNKTDIIQYADDKVVFTSDHSTVKKEK